MTFWSINSISLGLEIFLMIGVFSAEGLDSSVSRANVFCRLAGEVMSFKVFRESGVTA